MSTNEKYNFLQAMYIWGIFSLLDLATAKDFIDKCNDKLVNGITDVQLCPDDRGLGHLMVVSVDKVYNLYHFRGTYFRGTVVCQILHFM